MDLVTPPASAIVNEDELLELLDLQDHSVNSREIQQLRRQLQTAEMDKEGLQQQIVVLRETISTLTTENNSLRNTINYLSLENSSLRRRADDFDLHNNNSQLDNQGLRNQLAEKDSQIFQIRQTIRHLIVGSQATIAAQLH